MTNRTRHAVSVAVVVLFGLLAAASGGKRKGDTTASSSASGAAATPAPSASAGPSWWSEHKADYEQLLTDSAEARKKKDVEAVRKRLADAIKEIERNTGKYSKNRPSSPEEAAEATAIFEKLNSEQQEVEKVYKASYLANRKFVAAGADGIFQALIFNSSAEELWEKQYEGKYVRWQAKFVQKDMGVIDDFTANVGERGRIECSMLDDDGKKALDGFKRWQAISIEGKLARFSKASGDDRAVIGLKECIVK